MNLTEYIFSKLGDVQFDYTDEILFQFDEEEIEFSNEIISQFENFQNGNEVRVSDLVNNQILIENQDEDLQLLISLLCMYRSRSLCVQGDSFAKEQLKRNLSKIWYNDRLGISDLLFDKLTQRIFLSGLNFVTPEDKTQISKLSSNVFENKTNDEFDSEIEETITYSLLS